MADGRYRLPCQKSHVCLIQKRKISSQQKHDKNASFKRKRGDELPLNDVSASEDEEEIDSDVRVSLMIWTSEGEDSISGNLQDKIIQFLQEASLDELL